jgi:preprotein translocase subunit SecD
MALLVGGLGLCLAACGSSASHTGTTGKPSVVLTARVHAANAADTSIIRTILLNRFRAVGARDATVDLDQSGRLVRVRIPAGEAPTPAADRELLGTGALRFRPLLYSGDSPLIFPFSEKPTKDFPGCAALLEKSPPDTDAAPQVVLPDRDRKFCYVLGPAVVTGRSIASAGTVYDSTEQQWVATVKFHTNDFAEKVGAKYLGRQVAIELDGVVQSAPTIQPGITGRDVQITGQFTKDEAENLALVLRYGALPVQLDFVSSTNAR